MSLEAWGDEDPDNYMTTESAVDNGWLTPEDADLLKHLVGKLVEHPDPNHEHNAALLLIRATLEPMPVDEASDEPAKLAWARVKIPGP